MLNCHEAEAVHGASIARLTLGPLPTQNKDFFGYHANTEMKVVDSRIWPFAFIEVGLTYNANLETY